jgi:hypothetical protein
MYLQGLAEMNRKVGKPEGEVQRERPWRRPKDDIKMNEVFTFGDVTQRLLVSITKLKHNLFIL